MPDYEAPSPSYAAAMEALNRWLIEHRKDLAEDRIEANPNSPAPTGELLPTEFALLVVWTDEAGLSYTTQASPPQMLSTHILGLLYSGLQLNV